MSDGAVINVPFEAISDEELSQFDYFNAMVEQRIAALEDKQAWVEIVITAPSRVASMLKLTWEAQNYSVGVFLSPEGFRVVLAPKPEIGLPALPDKPILVAPTERRLLVRMPTRERPGQAIEMLTRYRKLAGVPITIEVVIDGDDETMLACDVQQRLAALDCVVTVDKHGSKIAAVNGGRVSEWDVLLLASDDMMPVADGYAKIVLDEMEKHFPHLDGALYFDDGYAHDDLCTLPIMGRHLYDQFGYVYEPAYKSLWSDSEQTDVLRAMGRLVYVPEKIIEHRHPASGKAPKDALYKRNDDLRDADLVTYEKRRAIVRPHAQWGFDAPPLVLSVCIAAVKERRTMLDRLLDFLYGQIVRDAPRKVEVVVEPGDGQAIGAVRQRLLEKARGHYVAFVDDDDWIAHDYVKQIVGALEASAFEADCVTLEGRMTTDGTRVEHFEHSLKYAEWFTDGNGLHCRTPNHLNPVRRTLALKAGFPTDKSFGEDHDYSRRLRPFLAREVKTQGVLYHYWWRRKHGAAA